MWDEGFHQMLIMHWDPQLSMEIIHNWLQLQDADGWVAREQILGGEARSKVPTEFQIQNDYYANPPTLFIPLLSFITTLDTLETTSSLLDASMTDSIKSIGKNNIEKFIEKNPIVLIEKLKKIFQLLQTHFEWLRQTQTDTRTSTHSTDKLELFTWHGRSPNHCLTSGLDDYPRSPYPPPPDTAEFHLDLITWMAAYADALSRLASIVGNQTAVGYYDALFTKYNQTIHALFWSEQDKAYGDILCYNCANNIPLSNDLSNIKRDIIVHKGYLSLFPMLFGLIDSQSERFHHTLDLLQSHLWTPFGLRSLSPSDAYYGKDENYWRGPIWININYLVLRSLHLYYNASANTSSTSKLYEELRDNIVKNVYKQFKDTKYFWEQYNDTTGRGQRSHPFTGWTALVLNIMAEKY